MLVCASVVQVCLSKARARPAHHEPMIRPQSCMLQGFFSSNSIDLFYDTPCLVADTDDCVGAAMFKPMTNVKERMENEKNPYRIQPWPSLWHAACLTGG